MYAASARESEIKFFVVDVPREVYFFKVAAVPLTGDPDIYISFDTRTPTGANYTFMQDLLTPNPNPNPNPNPDPNPNPNPNPDTNYAFMVRYGRRRRVPAGAQQLPHSNPSPSPSPQP